MTCADIGPRRDELTDIQGKMEMASCATVLLFLSTLGGAATDTNAVWGSLETRQEKVPHLPVLWIITILCNHF